MTMFTGLSFHHFGLALADDGRRLIVEFILDDPEYLAEPFRYVREFLYSPEAEMAPFDCDIESTRRFVPG